MNNAASERDPSPDRAAPPPSPPPPRGPRPAKVVAWLAFGAVMLGAGVLWAGWLQPRIVGTWHAVFGGRVRPADGEPVQAVQFYTCGMHPWVVLPEPGLCPICHMELTPIDPDKFTGEISIDPVVTQNIGVRIAPVTKGPVVRSIRTVGTVDYDETAVRDVNTKVTGWIEKLYVDYLGDEVEAGQPLFDLYSPQLYEAQEEYLLEFRKIGGPEGVIDLLEPARTRLEYYDITPEQIRGLEQSGVPAKTMAIHSPHNGVVIAKHANEGMHVTEGMQVYRIADLSKVWVMVTLYEYQLPFVQVGQEAVMSLPYIPGQTFEGKIIYIYPYLDQKTRQVNVRLEFDNPNRLLKPGMFANVQLESTLAGERTLAPRSAILDTGERQVAFVSLGEGRFEPRDVLVGVETVGGMVEVLDGLRPGEMVVTSGQFLLDSEAKVREGLAKMVRGTMASNQGAVVAAAGASELEVLPAEIEQAIIPMVGAYFAAGNALAGDSTEGVSDAARRVAAGIDQLLSTQVPGDPHFWHRHEEAAVARGAALQLVEAADIEEARLRFADLSVALTKLLKATGIPPGLGTEVHQLHCPMYREGQGGSIWLQPKGSPRNPFFGSVMLQCFDERSVMPISGSAQTVEPARQTGEDAPSSQVPLDPATQGRLDGVVEAYLALQSALTRDSADDAAGALADLRRAAAALAGDGDAFIRDDARRLEQAASQATGLDAARGTFEGLSAALLDLVGKAPPTQSVAPALYEVYCPMVKKSWLQSSSEVANPYDPSMLRCGTVKRRIDGRNAPEATP